MRKGLFMLGMVVIFAMSGCKKDRQGNVEVVFKATYGGEPLTTFTEYDYDFGQKIMFSKADMYIANIVLTNGADRIDVSPVELVDFSFSNEAEAEAGYVIPAMDVKAVTYDRLDFVIGLDSEMNSGRPEDYPSDSPLSQPRYWEPWTSYIFAKTEGNLDTIGDGANFDLGFLYHTGTDPLARGLTAQGNFNVVEDGTLRITLTLDYKKLFGVGDSPIDIKSQPVNHNPLDSNEIIKFVDNYQKSISFLVE